MFISFSKKRPYTDGLSLSSASEYCGERTEFDDVSASNIVGNIARCAQVQNEVHLEGKVYKAYATLVLALAKAMTIPVAAWDEFVIRVLKHMSDAAYSGHGSVHVDIVRAMKSIALVKDREGKVISAPLVRERKGEGGAPSTFEGYRVRHYVVNVDQELSNPDQNGIELRIAVNQYRKVVATGKFDRNGDRRYQYLVLGGLPVLIICYPPSHRVVTQDGQNYAVIKSWADPFVAIVCGKNLPLLMGLTEFMGDAEAACYENLYPNIHAFMMDDRVKAVLAATAGQAPRLTSGRDSAPTKTPVLTEKQRRMFEEAEAKKAAEAKAKETSAAEATVTPTDEPPKPEKKKRVRKSDKTSDIAPSTATETNNATPTESETASADTEKAAE